MEQCHIWSWTRHSLVPGRFIGLRRGGALHLAGDVKRRHRIQPPRIFPLRLSNTSWEDKSKSHEVGWLWWENEQWAKNLTSCSHSDFGHACNGSNYVPFNLGRQILRKGFKYIWTQSLIPFPWNKSSNGLWGFSLSLATLVVEEQSTT